MRKVFLLLGLVLSVTAVIAQGNMQFNQVINLTISTSFAPGNSSSNNQTLVVTVPAGKVWKIESANMSYQSSSSSKYFVADASNEICQVVLDGAIIAVSSDDFYKTPGPIWLAEGAHTFILQGFINSSSQYRWHALITAIEFNVVP